MREGLLVSWERHNIWTFRHHSAMSGNGLYREIFNKNRKINNFMYGFCSTIAMGYWVSESYGFLARNPRIPTLSFQKPMGFEGVWVMRGMGYEGVDCNDTNTT